MRSHFVLLAFAYVALGLTGARAEETQKPPAAAQAPPGIKRTILQKFEVPGTNYEATYLKVEFEPNYDVPRHIHPGPEASYVLEGEFTLMLDGQEPRLMKPGDSAFYQGGLVHSGKVGPKGVAFLNSYVLEKGKPFLIKVDGEGKPLPPDPPK